jgi:hypothetical protein
LRTEVVVYPEPAAVTIRSALPATAVAGASDVRTTVGAGTGVEELPPPPPQAAVRKTQGGD